MMSGSRRFRAGLAVRAGLALALLWAPGAFANDWVGDLVYCDVNANGSFDAGDYPLNGVSVRVVCERNGAVCEDVTTTTGTLHPSVGDPAVFNQRCAGITTWNPLDPAALDGRYLVNANVGCRGLGHPRRCTVTVDPTTVPAACDVLVTPQAGGVPEDGNGDGDFCDAEDGPFPEAQPLGNAASQGGCEAFPDPAPADYTYPAILNRVDECSLHHDFGFTEPSDEQPPTRTPGYWKNHPQAVALFGPVWHCGTEVTDTCAIIALLATKGGGFSAFTRHSAAAQLNCAAYGCPAEIHALIHAGEDACAAGDPFDFTEAANRLDVYNNLGDALGEDPVPGPADPKFCKPPKNARRSR